MSFYAIKISTINERIHQRFCKQRVFRIILPSFTRYMVPKSVASEHMCAAEGAKRGRPLARHQGYC